MAAETQILVKGIPESFAAEGLLEEYFGTFGEVTSVVVEEGGSATINFGADVNLDVVLEESHVVDEVLLKVTLSNDAKRRKTSDEGAEANPDVDEGGEPPPEEWDQLPEGMLPEEEAAEEPPAEEGEFEADGEGKGKSNVHNEDESEALMEGEAGAAAGQTYRRGERYHEAAVAGTAGGPPVRRSEDERGGRMFTPAEHHGGTVERNKIFVGALQAHVVEEDIWKYFSYYAKPKYVDMRNGYAFVTFDSEQTVRKILTDFDTHKIKDRWVECRAFGKFNSCPPGAPVQKDRIFVGGLDREIASVEKLTTHFSQYGVVADVDLKWDRGFAFVVFKSGAGVQLALWDHGKHFLDGTWWFDVQPCVEKGKGDKGDGKGKGEKGEKGDGKKGKGYTKPTAAPYPEVRPWHDNGKGVREKGGSKGVGKPEERREVKGGKERPKPGVLTPSNMHAEHREAPVRIPPRVPPAVAAAAAAAATGGPVAAAGVPAVASGPAAPPSEWTAAGVQRFLKNQGLEELCGTFAEQEVTGKVLLSLSESDLEGNLGVKKFGQRRQLVLAIEELRRSPGNSGSGKAVAPPKGAGKAAKPAGDSQMLRPQLRPQTQSWATPPPAPRQSAQTPAKGAVREQVSYSSAKGIGKDWAARPWIDNRTWSEGSAAGKGKSTEGWRSKPY